MTELTIYNSLTRNKQRFEPIEAGKLRMYVCGVTPYDYCHVGHARCYTVFDTVLRYFRARGYDVTYVRNITDIDDKIIQRANENGEGIDALTGRFIEAMYEDFDALGIERPDIEPRATEYMAEMIDMIQRLIANDAAYAADNGDVYYKVRSFDGYGRLSGKNLDDLRAGARVDVDQAKQDPLDFVLWKAAKPDEPAWDSPWGRGRPGWHIECSAMSEATLGKSFDIHGGGMDLKFPHHENEIAQSCGAHDGDFARYWVHNGFVNVDEEKMSKSLGNFFTIREVLKLYRPEVLRFFLLSSHYRSPLNYTEDNLDKARSGLERLYLAMRGEIGTPGDEFAARFNAVMDDDLNTPQAISVLFDIAHAINTAEDDERALALRGELRQLGGTLGLLQQDAESYLRGGGDDAEAARIEALIDERNQARRDRNFARADEIRDQLAAEGIQLDDGPDGTSWRRAE